MLSTIVDRIKIDKESKTLKAQVDQMLSAYHAKEEMCTAAVARLEGSHEAIIREAEEKAAVLFDQATKEIEMLKKTAEHEREEWEAEKASVAGIQTFRPIIKICVGGEKFTTSLTTLTRFPDTMIGAMFSGRHALVLDDEGYHFIDRDGTHFRYILNFLRSPETFHQELTGAALMELKGLKTACEYYGLKSLMFPFVPIAAFATTGNFNDSITVQQDENGIFSAYGQPLRLCAHCGAASCDPNNRHRYIRNFRDIVAAKGGTMVEGQPG